MVDTNMGRMPIADYREIIAMQHGFDSYADMRKQGFCIGNGMDSDINPKKESVVRQLSQKPENVVTGRHSNKQKEATR